MFIKFSISFSCVLVCQLQLLYVPICFASIVQSQADSCRALVFNFHLHFIINGAVAAAVLFVLMPGESIGWLLRLLCNDAVEVEHHSIAQQLAHHVTHTLQWLIVIGISTRYCMH